jgi:hypothetical protein
MRHLKIISRYAQQPARAGDMDDLAKVIEEVLTLVGQFIDVLSSWQDLREPKE